MDTKRLSFERFHQQLAADREGDPTVRFVGRLKDADLVSIVEDPDAEPHAWAAWYSS